MWVSKLLAEKEMIPLCWSQWDLQMMGTPDLCKCMTCSSKDVLFSMQFSAK